MNIIHLDSSILGNGSVSRGLSAQVVAKLKAEHPEATVSYHDLAANPLPHLTLTELGTEQSKALLNEFKAAHIIVIGAPMYNFGIPSQLKAYIDRIAIAGETFKYTAEGPVGLMGDKRVIIAAANGGYYHAQNAAGASMNHQTAYLKSVFAFLGITPEVIAAEGIAVGPEAKAAGIATAQTAIAALNV